MSRSLSDTVRFFVPSLPFHCASRVFQGAVLAKKATSLVRAVSNVIFSASSSALGCLVTCERGNEDFSLCRMTFAKTATHVVAVSQVLLLVLDDGKPDLVLATLKGVGLGENACRRRKVHQPRPVNARRRHKSFKVLTDGSPSVRVNVSSHHDCLLVLDVVCAQRNGGK